MKKEDIDFIKSLDPEKLDGTIQFFIMEGRLEKAQFKDIAKLLLQRLSLEKAALVEDNIKLSRKLQEHGIGLL